MSTPHTANTSPATAAASRRRTRNGLLASIGCSMLWGVLPIYWNQLSGSSFVEIIGHRMFWSAVLLLVVSSLFAKADLRSLLRQRRAWRILGSAGLIITGISLLYVYMVISGRIVEAALAYYINPLTNILFGAIFFRERLKPLEAAATVLALVGVLYFTVDYGHFPAFSIILAVITTLYAAIKKTGGYPVLPAMTMESTLMLPVAIGLLAATFILPGQTFMVFDGPSGFAGGMRTTLLLIGGGAAITLPYLLYSKAANDISLTWMGFTQYIEPTLTLLIGVFLYGEAFTQAHLVCFVCIWAGLLLVSLQMLRRSSG
ncbi:MAG: EamA family transporter RarD [Coriobacteriales bacterium]|jgi:chloramphenicol-sensitive protein RarD|nr:EamA family transporter RarD [Coriobacteriales bacterium]